MTADYRTGAARWLGLTTQSSGDLRRRGAYAGTERLGFGSLQSATVQPTEVALIEMLRAGLAVVERPCESLSATVTVLVDRPALRAEVLDE